ncbi:unnamed protein product, partial [Mesorhabditis spiculigera]
MRPILIISLFAATISSHRLFYIHRGSEHYIATENVPTQGYMKIDDEKAQLFKRVWLFRSTELKVDDTLEVTAEHKQQLAHAPAVPDEITMEFVTWRKNEDRYFVFDAPRFYEVDHANFTLLRNAAANYLDHLLDDGLLTVHCERTTGKQPKSWTQDPDTIAMCVMCFGVGILAGVAVMISGDHETRSAKNKTKQQKSA